MRFFKKIKRFLKKQFSHPAWNGNNINLRGVSKDYEYYYVVAKKENIVAFGDFAYTLLFRVSEKMVEIFMNDAWVKITLKSLYLPSVLNENYEKFSTRKYEN